MTRNARLFLFLGSNASIWIPKYIMNYWKVVTVMNCILTPVDSLVCKAMISINLFSAHRVLSSGSGDVRRHLTHADPSRVLNYDSSKICTEMRLRLFACQSGYFKIKTCLWVQYLLQWLESCDQRKFHELKPLECHDSSFVLTLSGPTGQLGITF